MLTLFNRRFGPGEKAYFTLEGPVLCNRAAMQIPVIVLCGKEPGPVLWVNGAVHGDEINGSYAVWEMINGMDPEGLKGCIVATPLANVAALPDQHKVSRLDDLDMDTQFPGDSGGAAAQILAKTIYDGIRQAATHLISMHTISKLYNARPYTVAKIVPGADEAVNKTALEMAKAFGVECNCVVDLATATGEMPGVTKGALDITCILDGIPAFMAEIGHGGVVDPEMVKMAIRGMKNVMAYLGMVEGDVKRQVPKQYRITKRKFVRIRDGGILDMKVRPGDVVKAGDTIAQLHYFGDELTPYKVPDDAYIIAVRAYPAINTGDRVSFLGLEWEEYN